MALYFRAAAEALFNSLLSFVLSFVACFLFFAIIFLTSRTVLSGVISSFWFSWFFAEFVFLVSLFAFLSFCLSFEPPSVSFSVPPLPFSALLFWASGPASLNFTGSGLTTLNPEQFNSGSLSLPLAELELLSLLLEELSPMNCGILLSCWVNNCTGVQRDFHENQKMVT